MERVYFVPYLFKCYNQPLCSVGFEGVEKVLRLGP
jgi:hypothetical protein